MSAGAAVPAIDICAEDWRIVRGILQDHVPGIEVWAFGSRARGAAKPYSDLDLAIVTEAGVAPDVAAALRDAFTESDLPWKVDVVDWARTSAAFREIIARERVVVAAGGET
jgi:type I restriction enzyme S subunit